MKAHHPNLIVRKTSDTQLTQQMFKWIKQIKVPKNGIS